MNSASEAELLTWCRQGKPEAWDEIFSRHYNATGRFVFQLSSAFTREDVEEICQEVFLSAIRHIHTFKGESQFQTWIFRIAANKSRDYQQHQHAAKRGGGQVVLSLEAEDPDTGLRLDPPATASAPDISLLNHEQVQILQESLDQVGEPCREMIELRYFGDLSYEEIGATFNLNVKTVSSRLSRCLDRLEGLVRPKLFMENPTTSSV